MNSGQTVPANLTLWAHKPTPAKVDLTYRSPRSRSIRAMVTLGLCWALAPLVFFIPPHIPWALAAFLAGIFLAYRQWAGEYRVHGFQGTCPRCGNELTLKPGATITVPHKLNCFQCHHEPVLQVDRAAVQATEA